MTEVDTTNTIILSTFVAPFLFALVFNLLTTD